MQNIRGQCLCGSVEFEVLNPPSRIYQCHCSLCRKQSGAASNAAFIVPERNLFWRSGRELTSSYTKPTGFRSDFCRLCGSPVPNLISSTPYTWVPVGLLEGNTAFEVSAHLFMGSKAVWETESSIGVQHETMPAFAEFISFLHAGSRTLGAI